MNSSSGGQITWHLDVDSSKFNTGLATASANAKALGTGLDGINFKAFASNASTAFNGVASSIATLAKVSGALFIGGAFGAKTFLNSAAALEKTNAAFQVLIGDATRANKLFGQIKKFADTTPFEFPELAKAATTLLGYGIAAENVMDKVKRLGDAAAASGGDLNGITLAYAQMVGRGKVTGDNLRQLTENFVTLRSELSKVSGVPMNELDKAVENSQISVEELNAALDLATNSGGKFFGGTEKLAQTFSGRMSTLKDTIFEVGRNLLGVKVDPQLGFMIEKGGIFDNFLVTMTNLTQWLNENKEQVKAFGNIIIENFIPAIKGLATSFLVAKVAAIGFGIATAGALLPFYLIAAAITAVIGVLVFLQAKFQIFNKAWDLIREGAKAAWDVIVGAFRAIKEAAEPVTSFIADEVIGAFNRLKGAFDLVYDAAKFLFDFWEPGFEMMATVVQGVNDVVDYVFDNIGKAINPVVTFIRDHLVVAFKELMKVIGEEVKPVIDAFVKVWQQQIMPAWWSLVGIWNNTLKPALMDMKDQFMQLWAMIDGPVLNALKILGIIIGVVVVAPIVLFIATVVAVIAIFGLLVLAVLKVITFFLDLRQKVWDAMVGIDRAVRDGVGGVIQWFKELPGKIVNAVGDIGSTLYNAGKDLVQGFINGIKDKFNSVKETLGNLTGKLTSWKGPMKLDKVILVDSGKAVIQGFVNGMESRYGAVKSSLSGLTTDLSPSIVNSGTLGASAVPGGAGGVTVNQTNNIYNNIDMEQGLRDLSWRLQN